MGGAPPLVVRQAIERYVLYKAFGWTWRDLALTPAAEARMMRDLIDASAQAAEARNSSVKGNGTG